MSDAQVAGVFVLIAVGAALVGRWLRGQSPASLYRDEGPEAPWQEPRRVDLTPRAQKTKLRAGFAKHYR